MKVLIFSIFMLLGSRSIGQVSDTLLPNSYGSWSILYWQYDGWSVSDGYYFWLSYDLGGPLEWYGSVWTYVLVDGGEALMRSDSGKVYCRGWFYPLPYEGAPADTSEKVLYDFNMEINDTAYYEYSFPVTVEGIGISTILGVPKKAWFLNNNDTIVQGLGSTKGLFRPWMSFFESNQWICEFYGGYQDSTGTTTALSFSTSDCYLEFQEQSTQGIVSSVKDKQLYISSPHQERLAVFSATGKLIYCTDLEAGETNLNLDFLPSGIYILRVGSNHAKKIVLAN